MNRQLIRTATFERAAAKPKARSFPVVISTETPVQRDGFMEVLSHDESAIDLSRAPLPVIESHDRGKVNVGKVDNLRVENRQLRGDLILGSSARALELAADIEADIVTGISIGYAISTDRQDGTTITATRWMPFEVSIVAVPADITSGINRELPTMTDKMHTEVVATERTRALAIQSLATQHNLGDDFIRTHVASGANAEAVRNAALEVLANRSPATLPRMTQVSTGDEFREAAVDALVMRSGIHIAKPHAAAKDLENTALSEIARTCLSRASIRHGSMSVPQILQRAMSTSDFPLILENVAYKSLRQGYAEEPGTHSRWTRRTVANDFKTMSRVILGSAPDLDQVAELGTYTQGAFDEDAEKFAILKYGKLISISWEAMVNDNLSAFTAMPAAMGRAARRKEADLVYDVILANALAGQTMRDGKALFHADHANVVEGIGFSPSALDDARVALRRQTGVGGQRLNLSARYLIVPPEYEASYERMLALTTRSTVTGVESSPGWVSQLELIVEPRLTSPLYAYIAASPTSIDTVEVANLAGQAEPQMMQEDSFSVDARTYKVRHTVGARAIDHRGMIRVEVVDV